MIMAMLNDKKTGTTEGFALVYVRITNKMKWQGLVGTGKRRRTNQANNTSAGIPNFLCSTFAILKVSGFLPLRRAET